MNFGFGLVIIPVLPIAARDFPWEADADDKPDEFSARVDRARYFWRDGVLHRDVLRDRAVCLVGGQKSVGCCARCP